MSHRLLRLVSAVCFGSGLGSVEYKTMICKHLTIPVVAAVAASLLSMVPAEASRKHSFRPQIVVPPATAAEDRSDSAVAAPTAPVADAARPSTAARRGLLEILFGAGSGVGAFARPADEVAMDERMVDAVRVAERSARSRSIDRCWRYVKRALQKAGVIDCYPRTAFAKQAAVELPERYGFTEIEVADPFDAPVGSVLVYGGRGAGHVELRTETGFVSDHASLKPSPRPLIGVFIKPLEG